MPSYCASGRSADHCDLFLSQESQMSRRTYMKHLREINTNFDIYMYKNRSMGPKLIWPNKTRDVNVVFEKILALRRLKYILSSKRVIVQPKM